MSFIYRRWFGFIISLIIVAFLILFVLVLLSPRQDLQKRGFIPCTEAFAAQVLDCDGNRVGCLLSSIVANSWCDIKVVGLGASAWVSGKQAAPWSNYIFTPELQQDENFDAAAREEYLKTNHDMKAEIKHLQKLNKELENEAANLTEVRPEDQPE